MIHFFSFCASLRCCSSAFFTCCLRRSCSRFGRRTSIKAGRQPSFLYFLGLKQQKPYKQASFRPYYGTATETARRRGRPRQDTKRQRSTRCAGITPRRQQVQDPLLRRPNPQLQDTRPIETKALGTRRRHRPRPTLGIRRRRQRRHPLQVPAKPGLLAQATRILVRTRRYRRLLNFL